jgi:hypothetical protein
LAEVFLVLKHITQRYFPQHRLQVFTVFPRGQAYEKAIFIALINCICISATFEFLNENSWLIDKGTYREQATLILQCLQAPIPPAAKPFFPW